MDLNIKNRGDYKMECISCNDKINKDVDDYVVIDVFGKGSKREVVS